MARELGYLRCTFLSVLVGYLGKSVKELKVEKECSKNTLVVGQRAFKS